MIVLDATVLIAHLDAGDAHHDAAEARLLELAHEPFGASSITLAEILVGRHGRAGWPTPMPLCAPWGWAS